MIKCLFKCLNIQINTIKFGILNQRLPMLFFYFTDFNLNGIFNVIHGIHFIQI